VTSHDLLFIGRYSFRLRLHDIRNSMLIKSHLGQTSHTDLLSMVAVLQSLPFGKSCLSLHFISLLSIPLWASLQTPTNLPVSTTMAFFYMKRDHEIVVMKRDHEIVVDLRLQMLDQRCLMAMASCSQVRSICTWSEVSIYRFVLGIQCDCYYFYKLIDY